MTMISVQQLINEIGYMIPISVDMIKEIAHCSYELAYAWVKRWSGQMYEGQQIIGWTYNNKRRIMIAPPKVKFMVPVKP